MDLPGGVVTAIIGENGAGKSTLMKILSGVYTEYDGRILFKGNEVRFTDPKDAHDKGICIIHQELNLIPDFSITENIFLGRELTNSWGMLDKKAMRNKTAGLLQRLKMDCDPDTIIRNLKVGEQQVIEIAKSLLSDSEVIIMDEPTSAISDHEAEILFSIIEDLRKAGKAIVYISHKLDELFRIADRFVVMRDGQVSESGQMNNMNHDLIIQKMVGRDIQKLQKKEREIQSRPLLSINGLTACINDGAKKIVLDNISFNLNSGEIMGIFGLMGAGRTELLESILGMHDVDGQPLAVDGVVLKAKSPRQTIKAGVVMVPEDRKKDGIIAGLDVKTNMSISNLNGLTRAGFIDNQREMELAAAYTQSLRIKAQSPQQRIKDLSGGNQQKVILARCLATNPKVLLLDEPTRGIDANAKNEIYKLILELSEQGLGIIMVSSELPEILAVSDRVLVMAEGRITAEFSAAEAKEDSILKAAIPKTI